MLVSLQIKNFRSCEDVTIRLDKPVIAFLGKNGVGKTTILHGIKLAAELCAGRDKTQIITRPLREGPTVLRLRFALDGATYEYHTRFGYLAWGQRVPELDSFSRDGELLIWREDETAKWSGGVARIGSTVSLLGGMLQILPREDALFTEIGKVTRTLESIEYYPQLKEFREHWETNDSPIIMDSDYQIWKASIALGQASRDPSGTLMRLLDLHLTNRPRHSELLGLLGDDGLGLVNLIEPEIMSASGVNGPAGYLMRFRPTSQLAGAGELFRHTRLSAGTWRIVQMLTALIYDEKSCMLVEEPEDSIHPGMLEKVIDVFRGYSDRTQFICATHSPSVINSVRPEGIRLVSALDGKTRVEELIGKESELAEQYIRNEGTLAEFVELLGN